jgi:PIN domain of ribonuclease
MFCVSAFPGKIRLTLLEAIRLDQIRYHLTFFFPPSTPPTLSNKMTSSTHNVACRNLVLDAGPLLMLSPLRGLAETFVTVPQVLEELKDKRAREHFEKLGLIAGVNVKVQSPDPVSLAHGEHLLSLLTPSHQH